ncbi:hypothetical protein GbCGDNIH6_8269 [Granulibacter bethesdensis]|nr:hypothetical protein GbCGDNIH6_8269 [Granulibacter bethesdensis]
MLEPAQGFHDLAMDMLFAPSLHVVQLYFDHEAAHETSGANVSTCWRR